MPFAQTRRAVSRTTPAIPQSVTEVPVGLGVPADSNSGKTLFCVRGRFAVLSSPATWQRCIISAALPPWTSASARPRFHGRPARCPTGCVRRSLPRTVEFDWFHHPQPGTRSRGRPLNSQATAHRRNECRAPRGWQWVNFEFAGVELKSKRQSGGRAKRRTSGRSGPVQFTPWESEGATVQGKAPGIRGQTVTTRTAIPRGQAGWNGRSARSPQRSKPTPSARSGPFPSFGG